MPCALSVVLAGSADAATIFISDFTAPQSGPTSLAAYGGWLWTTYSSTDPDSRKLLVNITNTPADYLQEASTFNHIDISGGTHLQITGSWDQIERDGHFLVILAANGATRATAEFTFGQFANGPQAVTSLLTFDPSAPDGIIDQWQIVGNGNSSSAWGEFRPAEMSVVSVPEPSTLAMAGAGLAYAGWAAMRRRTRRAYPA